MDPTKDVTHTSGSVGKLYVRPKSDVVVLKDVVVPDKYYHRIMTGVPVIDEIFGGTDMPGLLPGTSLLLTGAPGLGKSTIALQLAELLAKNAGRNVLYNMGEENLYMVKLRANRIGVEGNFAMSMIENVDEVIRYCDENGVEVLFNDSLQTTSDGALTGPALMKSVTKKLHEFADATGITVFIIGHVTKAGTFAGPRELQHVVHAHISLSLNKETGHRIMMLEKNRSGPALVPYEFALNAQGMDFKQITEGEGTKPGEGTGKGAERRDKIKDQIKELLLKGERVSGYCFERLNVECSGGFWRGMIAKAVKELQAAGQQVGETRNGPGGEGRTHWFVVRAEDAVPADEIEAFLAKPLDDDTEPSDELKAMLNGAAAS